MRAEQHSSFGDPPKTVETENLESTGVREDGARPAHELMQSSELADRLMPGPQIKMIRVAQDDLRVQIVQQVAGKHAFDRGLRTDRHEDGSLHVAVRGVEDAGPRPCGGADGLELEAEHSFIVNGPRVHADARGSLSEADTIEVYPSPWPCGFTTL